MIFGQWIDPEDLRKLAPEKPNPPPPPSRPPDILVNKVTLVARAVKLDKEGNAIIENGQKIYAEEVLAVGNVPEGYSSARADSKINLHNAMSQLLGDVVVYVKVELGIVESGDRSSFNEGIRSITGALSMTASNDRHTVVSEDGKRMAAYLGIRLAGDGLSRGEVGQLSFQVSASYNDEYDSSANTLNQPKTVTKDVRINLENNIPLHPMFKKTMRR